MSETTETAQAEETKKPTKEELDNMRNAQVQLRLKDIKTVEDFHDLINEEISEFSLYFLALMPKSQVVAPNIQILADRLMSVKESAKLLVNNFVVDQSKQQENKESTND